MSPTSVITSSTLSCSSTLPKSSRSITLFELLSQQKKFGILVKLLTITQLKTTLSQPGNYTLLAPTDEAFRQLPQALIQTLTKPENLPFLQKLLTHHLVEGEATVFRTNLQASNGIIYEVDQVLIPSESDRFVG